MRSAWSNAGSVAGAGMFGALPVPEPACKEKTQMVIEADARNRNQTDEAAPSEGRRRIEVFRDKMTTFLNAAEEKLKTEHDNLEDCRTKFIAYGRHFCSDFKDIYKKEEQVAIKEKLKEAKKLQEERKSLTQPKKEGGLKARLQKLSNVKKGL
ncbi:hypothetical protein ACJJTC_018693 [Scirpophaga incertulas]